MSAPALAFHVGAIAVWSVDGALAFRAGMQVDADGAPNAYHPPTAEHPLSGRPPGLDDLRNASAHLDGKAPWVGVVVGPDGNPVVQRPSDPCPGFLVSQTALEDGTLPVTDPRRYVDSTKVPYVSLPGAFERLARLGDVVAVCWRNRFVGAIWADVGPARRLGEASIATSAALGLYHGNVNDGHDPLDVAYVVFPGTAAVPAWPRRVEDVGAKAAEMFAAWGGPDRIGTVLRL